MKYNVEEVKLVIRNRRSTFPRDYSGEKVAHEVVEEILESANWAPSHKLTQPWRFTVFSGSGLAKLATFQAACYKEVSSMNGTFKEEKHQSLLTKPMLSSHIIAVAMKRDEKERIPEV